VRENIKKIQTIGTIFGLFLNHYFSVQNLEKSLEYGQEFLNVSKPYFNSFRIPTFIRCSQILFSLGDFQSGMNYAFHALSESMNMGGSHLITSIWIFV